MQSPKIELHLGDCLEIMKSIPDKSIDLIVTSPPYNMGGESLGGHKDLAGKHYINYEDNLSSIEYQQFIFKVIDQCLLKSRYVFWNMQFVVSTKETILQMVFEYKKFLKDIFIWHKQAVAQICVQRSPILANGYEFVFMFGEDNSKIFKYSNFPKNGYVPNIQTWYKKEGDFQKEHHATFPKSLPSYFIQYFSNESDTILDPFMGSGTTGVACAELKRNFIGIEIEEKYFTIAKRRIDNAVAQLQLF